MSKPNPILHKAIVKGNLKSVQYWVKKGENIEGKNSDGQTALHYAASVNRLPIVEFLLEKGAKIEEKDKKRPYPTSFCCFKRFPTHSGNIDQT